MIPRLKVFLAKRRFLLGCDLFSGLAAQHKDYGKPRPPRPSFAEYKEHFMFSSATAARNPFRCARIIVESVWNSRLTAGGLTRVEKDADLRVSYVTATEFRDLQTGDVSYGYNVQPASLVPSGSQYRM